MPDEKVDIQLRFEEIFGSQDVSNLPISRNENTFEGYEFEALDMSYYTEQEATRINKEIDKLKPLIEKYLAERLQKTIDKFGLEYGWIGNYSIRREDNVLDFYPLGAHNNTFDEIHEYFWGLVSEDIQQFMKCIEYEVEVGEQQDE